ncbi:MAG: MFS transporter [Candidatus Altiarchaeota archaeon]|nr:MFS transporter [Candidatus Altiarchaeota archaeon]
MDATRAIVPYKILLAAFSFLPALLVLELGGDAVSVGFVSAVQLTGMLFGPLFWSKLSLRIDRRHLVALGYLAFFVGLLLLSRPGWIYPAVFIIEFFSASIFYALLSELKHNSKNISKGIGKFEQIGELAWAAGLLLGFVAVQFLSLQEFTLALALLVIAAFPFISKSIDGKGAGSVIKQGVKGFGEISIWVKGGLEQFKLSYQKPSISSDHLPFYLIGIFYSIVSGTIMSQIPTLLVEVFSAGELLYLLSFAGVLFTASFCKPASTLKTKSFGVGYILKLITFSILILSAKTSNFLLLLLFFAFNGTSWAFIKIFFEYFGLKLGEEVLGNFMFFRLLAYTVGSAASGFIVRSFGFSNTFLFATLFLLINIPIYLVLLKKHRTSLAS